MPDQPSSPPPTPSFQEQLTNALVKLIVTGSGGSALYFLYVSKLPEAAIAAIVTFGSSLLTSFGDGLMKPLSEGMGKRGERLAKATDAVITKTVDRPLETLGFQKQYQEALKAYCYKVEIEGFQDLPGLALEDVFVPLRIESTGDRRIITGSQEIWEFLPKRATYVTTSAANPDRRIAVLAGPGYGKTTLLRHLTFVFASHSIPPFIRALIPVLLRFREVHALIQDGQTPALPDLITNHLQQQAEFQNLEPKPSKNWFHEKLWKGDCLVMLDGLDEVPKSQRPKVRQWVDGQMKAYRHTQFILTSRPHGFELDPDDPDSIAIAIDRKLRVLDFTPDQKQHFIEKWYRTVIQREWERLLAENRRKPESRYLSETSVEPKIEQEIKDQTSDLVRQIVNSPSLNDLARNPLLMTMITTTHRTETELPKRRVELYDKICSLLLGTRPRSKKTPLTLPASGNRAVLQVLAWNLVQQEKTQFTPKEGADWIRSTLLRCGKKNPLNPEQFWQEMTEVAGLLVEQELGQYEFSHQTFQEYFAAVQIKETGQDAILLEKLTNDRWEEVICFFAALGDASQLLNTALDRLSANTLKLAQRLEDEGREVDEQTRDRLEQTLSQAALESVSLSDDLSGPAVRSVVEGWTEFQAASESENVSVSSSGWHEVVTKKVERLPIEAPLFTDQVAKVRLRNRVRQLIAIDDHTEIDPEYITWGEYQLFLEAQAAGQFHSQAALTQIPAGQEHQPVTGISWADARWFCAWFCAWLASQPRAQSEEQVYDVRLPTEEELNQFPVKQLPEQQLPEQQFPAKALATFTHSPNRQGSALRIVREQLPENYRALVNYLANGRWREADEETNRVMLEVAGQTARGYLLPEDIKKFPGPDLRRLDQLWVKFSGGQFGFSVQKQIYLECGAKLDGIYPGDEIWERFGDRVGWRMNNTWLRYDQIDPSLASSRQGISPVFRSQVGVGEEFGFSSLASMLVKYNL